MEAMKAPEGASAHASGDERFKLLDAAMRRQQNRADSLLEVLHTAQELFGFLPDDVLIFVGRGLKLPLSRVYGVATFYNLFTLEPRGVHTCDVCMGTACSVKGAGEILAALVQAHGVRAGQTSPDGTLSVLASRCVGTCGIAPAVVFDGEMTGMQTKAGVLARVRGWVAP